jgi:hypothetical protein
MEFCPFHFLYTTHLDFPYPLDRRVGGRWVLYCRSCLSLIFSCPLGHMCRTNNFYTICIWMGLIVISHWFYGLVYGVQIPMMEGTMVLRLKAFFSLLYYRLLLSMQRFLKYLLGLDWRDFRILHC